MEPRLQPLRIPSGWNVSFNDGFYNVDPPSDIIDPADPRWSVFKEDMLQLIHPRFDRLLDVGWYPEGDLANGKYVLRLFEGDFHGRLLRSLETRNRLHLVYEIEYLLALVTAGDL
ncbi:MAG: hypothetical protein JWN70_885 [Planctomycetaceae bacterium]|nr:hypothetical protein [Planctomycetaceae bacterium]